ncbi:Trp biosynthesis-associated membrane protein [Luteococcus sp. Sow4_B9]|uniref:Trp biosynthesis-associated membrane protein n=1 Tax=Luteococcus sp. Sow4_B9 TaxID=3438792 RepID=UPI003F9C13D9
MKPAQLRLLSWLTAAAGAVLAIVWAAHAGTLAATSRALGWSLLASVGLAALLGVWGRRLVGLVQLLLAAGLVLVVSSANGAGRLWLSVALAVIAGLLQILTAHRWPHRASRFERSASAPGALGGDLDIWKAMDAGLDPTEEGFGGSLEPRETSPDQTRPPRPAPSGADQEDQ